MENSMNSMSKAPFCYGKTSDDEFSEESGWTMYFEDFFANNNSDRCIVDDGYESSSLVSDAASSVVKKIQAGKEQVAGLFSDKSSNRSSFKKRRTKGASLIDNDLEDTASSPVNSPKVCHMMNQMDNKNPKQKDITREIITQEKGPSIQTDERTDQLGFDRRDSDCTELKKRGLCLVPLSMVANYLG